MNSEIRTFEQTLIRYINQVTLPIEIKRLVLKDIFNQIENIANITVNEEIQKRNEEKVKEDEKEANNNENHNENERDAE